MIIDPETMRAAAEEASELLKSLGNRHRLLILCQLVQGEKSVGQLAEFLGIRDSTVSQHLALLRRDRIIAGRRDGQTIWYRIESVAAREARLKARGSIMTNAAKLAALGEGGTNCAEPLAALNAAGVTPDLVIFVSDDQSWVDRRQGGQATASRPATGRRNWSASRSSPIAPRRPWTARTC
ncbi:ArsR/SmtB family transcription factor [Pseudogemmobacter sonorensis]|uniref:ArsR/SmtB family transcription factor n=1 Tax=Pseudogemmobacter sonorensis TaxID=2989681 RepID=UPI00368B3E6A